MTSMPSRRPTRFAVLAILASLTLVLTANANAHADEPAPMGPLNPMNWKMPELKMPSFKSILPGAEEKTRIKKKKDGLFSEVTQSATNSWNRTKEVFNPQKLNPTRFFTASSKTQSKNTGQTKPNFFQSLLSPAQPEVNEPSSVTDFLRQDRIEQ